MKDLRTLRQEKKMSQAELAKKAEINPVTFNNVENGKTLPHAQVRHNIEKILQQRVNWISTCGLGTNNEEKEAWEQIESSLRRTIISANQLSIHEKKQFIAVAKAYLKTFEESIELADENQFLLNE